MGLISTSDTSYEFIELDRTFYELSAHSNVNDDVDISRAFSSGRRLLWTDLIKEYRLIILSEAGSGKTTEIRNVAHTLREKGILAFFLRLEHIPSNFEDAFEVGTHKDFEEWLASSEEGWLLLDSVDEARLRDSRHFELAIRKFGRLINTAKDRAHIVITGRTTAWRTKPDLDCCTKHLPYGGSDTSRPDQQVDNDTFDSSVKITTEMREETKSTFKIVALDELTRHQVAVFTRARGIKDGKAFLDAVERADAWSFTSRPQDLEELIGFWHDKGRIGTRLEMIRNSINRRLAERDQDRAHANPLSAELSQQGARLLAAATTLAQDQEIRIPDGIANTKGIAVQSVLPDWNDKDLSTLLSRPIFDAAIYGTVRFHHRSVREYLTAEWFAELLNRKTSRRTIEGLFFRNQYGLDIVVPVLRPILPWLAILDQNILERIRKIAPEIIFEGGDPSQLPLEIRRSILYEVCKQMADGTTDHSIRDYAPIQRFANPDLSDDVRALIHQYADNEELKVFLLRMVWLGKLAGTLTEVMDIALMPTSEHRTRRAAFRAINAIGSTEDQDQVRQSLLAEASELDRELLAGLLEDVRPTEQILGWLLACLEKSTPRRPHTVDYLVIGITEFVRVADIELLPQFVTGLNTLLNLPPVIERRYCEVSEKFQWLIEPASKAVERLILARHPASLEPDTLATLHKISAIRGYGSYELNEIKVEFSKLVPDWKELNQALFWFEVQRSREIIDKKRKDRLTDFQSVSIFGSFWQFEESDFEYVVEEISHQTLQDNRLVALSLAFVLYKAAKRPRTWRWRLKKLVADNDELSERLDIYLRPPAQSRDSRLWKQQEARWKRRDEAQRKKQEKKHADQKKYLNDNLDEIRAVLHDRPETLTKPLLYLFNQTQNERRGVSRWAKYNWKTLIPEYGEQVARFYRDGTVSFWRHHEPKLRSESASPNETTYGVIIGLNGLEIEANETKDWPKNLSIEEVERACRYAFFELNGFPTWFPKLFETHPKIVCKFLLQEIRYELSIEKPDVGTERIISNLSWSGQWAWDQLAPSIYDLVQKEPKNLFTLDKLLKILQGSTLPDDLIEKLASRKCRTLRKSEHVAHWFAVWTGVAPEDAITSLKTQIGKITNPEKQTLFAMTFLTHLWGSRTGYGSAVRGVFKTPKYLKLLYLLMHEYIRREEDINRIGAGVYTPELRDKAQEARESLLSFLEHIPGKDSFLALIDIAKVHPEEAARPWILLQAKTKAEQDGDIQPWSPLQVREFHDSLERTPNNHRELAELAVLRLQDLKDDFENGDSSIATILQNVEQEIDMRKFIGRELREKAFGRYSIPQEEELADAKRPDLRFHGVGFDAPVPVELKLADRWTGPQLFERLENQLCGDYLRDNHSKRGIFMLVYGGKKKSSWDILNSNRLDFEGLITALQERWKQISPKFSNVDDITVIGIDLTKRAS